MSAPSNVRSLIAQVFAEMGGVGTLADVRQQVLALLPGIVGAILALGLMLQGIDE